MKDEQTDWLDYTEEETEAAREWVIADQEARGFDERDSNY